MFALFLGLRYTNPIGKAPLLALVIILALLLVVGSVTTVVTVMGIFSGFQHIIKTKIINTGFHIYVHGSFGGTIYNFREKLAILKQIKGVSLATPFFTEYTLLRTPRRKIISTELFGLQQDYLTNDMLFLSNLNIQSGTADLSDPHAILIGNEMAENHLLAVGDTIDLLSFTGQKIDPLIGFSVPATRRFTIKGIFKIGYYEYDSKMVIIPFETALSFFGKPNRTTGIGIKIPHLMQAEETSRYLKQQMRDKGYELLTFRSWEKSNRALFESLKNEKVMMSFIMVMVMMLACSSIMVCLIMIVQEKRRDIGVLKALGASNVQIAAAFLLLALLFSVTGVLIGESLGMFIANHVTDIINLIEKGAYQTRVIVHHVLGLEKPHYVEILLEDIYYFDKFPVNMPFKKLLTIGIGTVILSVLFAIFPTLLATSLQPVKAMRHE